MHRNIHRLNHWVGRNLGKLLIAAAVIGAGLAYSAHQVSTPTMFSTATRG